MVRGLGSESEVVGSLGMKRGGLLTSFGIAAVVFLAAAQGASAKPGDLIVADSGNARILRVDPSNGHKSTIASAQGLVDPAGMTFSPNGRLFVADYTASDNKGAIFRVNVRTHSVSPVAESSPFSQPVYVDYNPNGSLYAPDFEVPAIFRLSPTAGNPTALDRNSSATQAFGVEVDHNASLVVSDLKDGKLFRVNETSGLSRKIATRTPITDPYGIDIDPKGRILVADEESPYTIDRVDPATGKVDPLASGGLLSDVTQPAVAPSGKVFVAAGAAGVIRVNPKTGGEAKVTGANGGYFEGIEVQPPSCDGKVPNIVGSNKADRLSGSKFPDVTAALKGDDVIKGRRGNDVICAGPGDDKIIDKRGRNRIDCGPGHDDVITDRRSTVADCEDVTRS
jgi:streptogramin lyase